MYIWEETPKKDLGTSPVSPQELAEVVGEKSGFPLSDSYPCDLERSGGRGAELCHSSQVCFNLIETWFKVCDI